jgi:hypothetical protein
VETVEMRFLALQEAVVALALLVLEALVAMEIHQAGLHLAAGAVVVLAQQLLAQVLLVYLADLAGLQAAVLAEMAVQALHLAAMVFLVLILVVVVEADLELEHISLAEVAVRMAVEQAGLTLMEQ